MFGHHRTTFWASTQELLENSSLHEIKIKRHYLDSHFGSPMYIIPLVLRAALAFKRHMAYMQYSSLGGNLLSCLTFLLRSHNSAFPGNHEFNMQHGTTYKCCPAIDTTVSYDYFETWLFKYLRLSIIGSSSPLLGECNLHTVSVKRDIFRLPEAGLTKLSKDEPKSSEDFRRWLGGSRRFTKMTQRRRVTLC